VHLLWSFAEPGIEVDGSGYSNSENYYHSQKPNPFTDEAWDPVKEAVMERGVQAKLAADRDRGGDLQELLVATHPWPLLSLKADRVWGFHTDGRAKPAGADLDADQS